MKARWLIALLAALPAILPAGDEEALKLRLIPSPNLIRNTGFCQFDGKGHLAGWSFDNCSKSPYFSSELLFRDGGSCLGINAEWKKFGYWLQTIPVREGVTYHVGVDVQSDGPGAALWLQLPAQKKGKGQTEFLIYRHVNVGDEMREMLKDFVEEELIVSMSSVNWVRLDSLISVPVDRGITSCSLRVGVYGGNAGQIRYRNPFLREARSKLEIEVAGTGWTRLRVAGGMPETAALDPAKALQTVTVILPKAKYSYKVELSDGEGVRMTKEVSNE